jgi:hypothetical protein
MLRRLLDEHKALLASCQFSFDALTGPPKRSTREAAVNSLQDALMLVASKDTANSDLPISAAEMKVGKT